MTTYRLGDTAPRFASEDHWIAPTAVLIGRIHIGHEASVWWGSVLRGDNEPIHVGDRVNIQDNSVLHTDMGFPLVLETGVTVGHRAMLHGCEIGSYALVGIGATVLNGARVGEKSIIGAHALIPENKVIPPRSLVVGVPGRVVRELETHELQLLQASAEHYVDNAHRYRDELSSI